MGYLIFFYLEKGPELLLFSTFI